MMRAETKRLRRFFVQRFFDGQHAFAGCQSRSIADSKNVRIDGKGLGAEGGVHHHIRGLATNTGQAF